MAEVNRDEMLLRVGRVRSSRIGCLPTHPPKQAVWVGFHMWLSSRTSTQGPALWVCCSPCSHLQAAVQTMHNFQRAQKAFITDGLPLEMLCAIINNNVRCYNESLEFAGGLRCECGGVREDNKNT